PLLDWINKNAADVTSAVTYLRAPHPDLGSPGVSDPNAIAAYLASSKNTKVNSSATTNPPDPGGGLGASTIFTGLTAMGTVGGLPTKFGLPSMGAGLTASVFQKGGSTALAAYMQYKNFVTAERAAEGGSSIGGAIGTGMAAMGATMLWLMTISPSKLVTQSEA